MNSNDDEWKEVKGLPSYQVNKAGLVRKAKPFALGDKVHKVGGRYGGPGRVVSVSEALSDDGYRLYGVAMKVEGGYGEFVHVFPAACLRMDDGTEA